MRVLISIFVLIYGIAGWCGQVERTLVVQFSPENPNVMAWITKEQIDSHEKAFAFALQRGLEGVQKMIPIGHFNYSIIFKTRAAAELAEKNLPKICELTLADIGFKIGIWRNGIGGEELSGF